MEIRIKAIPAHIAYMAEYDVRDYNDFYDEKTGWNAFQDLEDRMRELNPDVVIPEIPDDYNYLEHPVEEFSKDVMHIKYYDMTLQKGVDSGEFRFVQRPEVTVAELAHRGPFETIGETYDIVCRWVAKNGYKIAGPGRSSSIHGPWDRTSRADYYTKVQIPIK